MDAVRFTARILSQEMIAKDIYSMLLDAREAAEKAVPGQFVSVYMKDASRLLPRPISNCEADKDKGTLRLVYKIAGNGTKEMSGWAAGEEISCLGPLGNGYSPVAGKKALLIGGGIGVPPMVYLAEAIGSKDTVIVAGYRGETFLEEELQRYGQLYIATDDGSKGTHGTVIDCIRQNGISCDIIYACGPKPMLKAVKAYAEEQGIPAFVSLEERMACGIGACYACVVKTKEKDARTNVHSRCVCKDGPVFDIAEVEL
ncbi:MAG: dihydroorotate dehydrogenase electron transfer subunit [Lachnospiraceae bacterium]|nr:dihydroorotate dehydrogenase electron transfer subunit [Lachnospiraceae bacterium]